MSCPRRWFRGHVWRATAPAVPHTSALGRATLVHREACARCGETRTRVEDAPAPRQPTVHALKRNIGGETYCGVDGPASLEPRYVSCRPCLEELVRMRLFPVADVEQFARLKAEFEARHRGTAPASLIEPMYPGAACVLTVPPRDGREIPVPGVSLVHAQATAYAADGHGDVALTLRAMDAHGVMRRLTSPEGRAALVAAIEQARPLQLKEANMPTESTPAPEARRTFCSYCGREVIRHTFVSRFDRDTGRPVVTARSQCPRWPSDGHDAYSQVEPTPAERAAVEAKYAKPTPEQLAARAEARARWAWRLKAGVFLAALLSPAVWAGWAYAPASFARWRATRDAEAALCRTATRLGRVVKAEHMKHAAQDRWWEFTLDDGTVGQIRRVEGTPPPCVGDAGYTCPIKHAHLGTPDQIEPPKITPVREAAGGEEF